MKATALVLLSLLQVYKVSCVGINIDLSRYHPSGVDKVFAEFYTVSEDSTKIDIDSISDDVGFFVIQVHSFIENVTLSNSSSFAAHSYVTGTNIGLVWGSGGSNATFYLLRNIKYMVNVRVLLVIGVYNEFDPVPGGCNLTFDTVLAPYQVTSYNDEYITVKSQPPSAYGVSCNDDKVKVDMYHLYLPEYDRKNTTYFSAIKKMLTVEDITRYGTKVPELEGYFKFRRMYSSYRGIGEVFGMIATYNNKSTAYVPAVSYGCNLLDWDQNCIGPVTAFWKLVCALLFVFGLFVCFLGHRFFKLTLYIIGFTFGVFITYLTISFEQDLTVNEKAITSFVVGFLYGIFWTFVWWRFGIPLLSVNLAFVLAGCIVASVIFYAGIDAVNSCLWVLLFLFGIFVQVRDQHGKPPFPPNRSGVVLATRLTERTPLIHPETVAPPEYV